MTLPLHTQTWPLFPNRLLGDSSIHRFSPDIHLSHDSPCWVCTCVSCLLLLVFTCVHVSRSWRHVDGGEREKGRRGRDDESDG